MKFGWIYGMITRCDSLLMREELTWTKRREEED